MVCVTWLVPRLSTSKLRDFWMLFHKLKISRSKTDWSFSRRWCGLIGFDSYPMQEVNECCTFWNWSRNSSIPKIWNDIWILVSTSDVNGASNHWIRRSYILELQFHYIKKMFIIQVCTSTKLLWRALWRA